MGVGTGGARMKAFEELSFSSSHIDPEWREGGHNHILCSEKVPFLMYISNSPLVCHTKQYTLFLTACLSCFNG
jgi:hypothetical protein